MGATSSARGWHRAKGFATYRLVRYADDFVVLVAGTRAHAEALRDEVAAVLAPMGLRLSDEKTRVAHIDEGFDFLGFRIMRQRKRGTGQYHVYTYPTKAALATVKAKVRTLTQGATDQSLGVLLHRLNPVLRGWTAYFRYGVSKRTFSYLRAFVWRRVVCWLRHKHLRASWKQLRRRYLPSSPWSWATARAPRAGPVCCGVCGLVASRHPSSRSATAPSVYGPVCGRSSPGPPIRDAGTTRP